MSGNCSYEETNYDKSFFINPLQNRYVLFLTPPCYTFLKATFSRPLALYSSTSPRFLFSPSNILLLLKIMYSLFTFIITYLSINYIQWYKQVMTKKKGRGRRKRDIEKKSYFMHSKSNFNVKSDHSLLLGWATFKFIFSFHLYSSYINCFQPWATRSRLQRKY